MEYREMRMTQRELELIALGAVLASRRVGVASTDVMDETLRRLIAAAGDGDAGPTLEYLASRGVCQSGGAVQTVAAELTRRARQRRITGARLAARAMGFGAELTAALLEVCDGHQGEQGAGQEAGARTAVTAGAR